MQRGWMVRKGGVVLTQHGTTNSNNIIADTGDRHFICVSKFGRIGLKL